MFVESAQHVTRFIALADVSSEHKRKVKVHAMYFKLMCIAGHVNHTVQLYIIDRSDVQETL